MDLEKWKTQLAEYFAKRESEIFAMIEKLVTMESYTYDGEDVNKVGDYITGWLKEAGFMVRKVEKAPVPEDEKWMEQMGNVYVAHSHDVSAGPGVAFIGHMDTVYPKGTVKSWPFKIEGDRATGPGVCDMKAGLVANMFAARAIKELGLMDTPMTLVFSCDEELGSPTSTPHFKKLLGGAQAVLCSEPGQPGGGVTTQRKGSGHLVMEITGKSAHAGRNYEEGASAIIELAHKILAFDKHLDLPNGTTVNTGIITGGTFNNCVAPNATGRVHMTFATVEAGQALVKALREEAAKTYVKGTSTKVTGGMRLYPLLPNKDVMALFDLVDKAGQAIGYKVVNNRTKGAAESGYCSSVLGIPAVCNMGPEGWELHNPKEYMIPSTVLPRCSLLALTALQAAKVFKPAPK